MRRTWLARQTKDAHKLTSSRALDKRLPVASISWLLLLFWHAIGELEAKLARVWLES